MTLDQFKARMDELIVTMKQQPKAQGVDEILVPGEREARRERERRERGIPLSLDVLAALNEEAVRSGREKLVGATAPLAPG
jgi:LDH2 family malate/lactate/ureidoglycolate dehydrogenase